MQLTHRPLDLRLRSPFRIAHGETSLRHNVLCSVDDGLGEAAAVAYHGETRQGIEAFLERARPSLERAGGVSSLGDVTRLSLALPEGSRAARAAIDMALCDVWGKRCGRPLWQLLDLDPTDVAETSFTLAQAAPETMAEGARRAGPGPLKLKLGSSEDEACLERVRAATGASLRADANGGWDRPRARAMLPILSRHGVELIEQPLAVGDLRGLAELHALGNRPRLFVDESIRSEADLEAHAHCVDGVVIKLAKAGGITPALAQIRRARSLGLSVMLGCMVESSVAVTAAAQLAPLADYLDLDGPLLVRDDPFSGVRYRAGRVLLPPGPGLGLEPVRA